MVPRTVGEWRKDADFSQALTSRLREYRGHFEDVPLAHRKDRVQALEGIFDKLDEKQVGLKIKVLQAIRQEVGDDKLVIEHHVSGTIGIETPPRALDYEEWVIQNELMESKRVDGGLVEASVRPMSGIRKDLPSGALAAANGNDTRPNPDQFELSPIQEVG